MGNSFSSKKKNKSLNFKKTKNILNTGTTVSNSATGRHSVGILYKSNLIKNKNEKNDIFTQIKNRNQLRESLRRSLRVKNIFDDTGDPRNTGNKGIFNSEFYLDYNKIFLEVFPSSHKYKIFKEIPGLDKEIENEENYINEDSDKDNDNYKENDSSRVSGLNKFFDKNLNGNHIGKKLDFSDESDKIPFNKIEYENNLTEGIPQEEKNVKVKSFITALSNERTEDFLVTQKSNNLDKDETEENKKTYNNEHIKLNDNLPDKKFLKNLNNDINHKQIIPNICNDINCLYSSKKKGSQKIKNINKITSKEKKDRHVKTVPDHLKDENYNNLDGELKYEIKVNEDKIDIDNEEYDEKNFYSNNKIKRNSLNLGLEDIGDIEGANKLNCFEFDNIKHNKNNNFPCETQEEESIINFLPNLGTPCKILDKSEDFEFTEEEAKNKSEKNLNLNSLVKLINKDSYFESPNSKNAKFNESMESLKKTEKEVKEFKSNESQEGNGSLNKSTVSSLKENSKEFICGDCLNRFNSPNKINQNIGIKLKIKPEKENQKDEKIESVYSEHNKEEKYELHSEKTQSQIILGLEEENNLAPKAHKSASNIRNNYITKLICNFIWLPNSKPKNHNSIIIFDWDDTLLCTTFLTPNGVFYDDLKIEKRDLEKITKLETLTYKILKSSIEKGDTFIITNAAPGWVEYSAKRFYPKVFPLLNKINIISARGEYEKKHPGDSRQWKILTFLKMVKIIDTRLVTNLICLGDSLIEMEAAHILASKFKQAFIKTVKFRENPTPEELFKQLQLILDQFEHIFSSVKNLTIKVERKNKNPLNDKTNYTSFQNLSNFDLSQIRNSMPNQVNGIKSAGKVSK